jgi:replicative DNA helicase
VPLVGDIRRSYGVAVPQTHSWEMPGVNGAVIEQPRLLRLRNLLDEWEADAEAAHLAHTTGTPRGPITNLKNLDRELGGALAPGLHVVHASPGVGKTAFCLQVASSSPFPALYLTCEMSPLELFRRHTARATGTYLGRLKSGEFEPAYSVTLAQRAASAAPKLAFGDATHAWAAPDWLQDSADVVKGDASHVLLVVDSVHSWAEAAPAEVDEYTALNDGLAALRRIARNLQCPVLAIAERNRAKMSAGGLDASAGSRRFEYGAESVLALNREKDEGADGEAKITLTIEKNRNGASGRRINLLFNGALQRFTEV